MIDVNDKICLPTCNEGCEWNFFTTLHKTTEFTAIKLGI